jgi:hypothetical protein
MTYSSDPELQYYAASTLGNMAVNPKHRAMMIAVGNCNLIKQLVKMLSAKRDKVNVSFCDRYTEEICIGPYVPVGTKKACDTNCGADGLHSFVDCP